MLFCFVFLDILQIDSERTRYLAKYLSETYNWDEIKQDELHCATSAKTASLPLVDNVISSKMAPVVCSKVKSSDIMKSFHLWSKMKNYVVTNSDNIQSQAFAMWMTNLNFVASRHGNQSVYMMPKSVEAKLL